MLRLKIITIMNEKKPRKFQNWNRTQNPRPGQLTMWLDSSLFTWVTADGSVSQSAAWWTPIPSVDLSQTLLEEVDNWMGDHLKISLLYPLGSQAGVVVINHPSHLYNRCIRIRFQLTSSWRRGFSPGSLVSLNLDKPFSSINLKIMRIFITEQGPYLCTYKWPAAQGQISLSEDFASIICDAKNNMTRKLLSS